jgi:hypothetical protein
MMVAGKLKIMALMVCCLIVVTNGGSSSDAEMETKIKEALAFGVPLDNLAFDERNYIEILSSGDQLTEQQMQEVLEKAGLHEAAHVQHYGDPPFSSSALGSDDAHHFLHAYLLGWVPFHTEHSWIPQYAIATRMRYQRDDRLFSGKRDVWQTSQGAFLRGKGDCEDHSVLLADWLIDMGLDARVVLGDYRGRGHAWVVVLDEDKFYLLEPTSKHKSRRWRHFPLARLIADYHPRIMFNRDTYWVNTGSRFTTNYLSEAWKTTSTYHSHYPR